MPRRGENIHKRKDGRWEGRYIQAQAPNGKGVYRSVYGKSYMEAKQKLAKAKAEARELEIRIPGRRITFEELFDQWIESNRIRYKESTLLRYQEVFRRQISPVMGGILAAQIDADTVSRILREKLERGRIDGKGGLSGAYVSSISVIIQATHSYGVRKCLCRPFSEPVVKPAKRRREVETLSRAEQRTLEAVLMQQMTETGLGMMISLYTGLRVGEICALRWEDVDPEDGIIHVRHTVIRVKKQEGVKGSYLKVDAPKTEHSLRIIPIAEKLLPILKKEKKEGNIYVLSGKTDFVNPATYQARFHNVMKAAGMRRVNYHALRHTFATRCVENGVDVKSLSEMLGHADAKITLNTYVHSSLQNRKKQMEKLKLD